MIENKDNIENKNSKKNKKQNILKTSYDNINDIEIGIDEVGRGPMFGRVYTAAVILPKDDDKFEYHLLKDSKKFHSKKKIKEVSDYIKKNALSWSIKWSDEKMIDNINIRNATHNAMHLAINDIKEKYDILSKKTLLLVDGNDFKNYTYINKDDQFEQLPHICIEGGDNKYCSIAAASILAKVERDNYIEELCIKEPELIERYDLLNNKGYGTKKHIEGIIKYGITEQHRKSFGLCKNY
jgi:ribonuclease HII